MEPWVPGWSEVMNGDKSCQHCRMDAPDVVAAEVVTFRYLAFEAASVNGAKSEKMVKVRENREYMAYYRVFGGESWPPLNNGVSVCELSDLF